VTRITSANTSCGQYHRFTIPSTDRTDTLAALAVQAARQAEKEE
jgi:hypothetical protein